MYSGGANVANSSVVAGDLINDGRSSAQSSSLQVNLDNDGCQPAASLSSSPGGRVDPGEGGVEDEEGGDDSGDTQSLTDFLSNHLSSGTKKCYSSTFLKFSTFCSNLNVSPSSCPPTTIARFLKKMFDDGASYSSVNLARSAISKNHDGFNGVPAGCHRLVSTAVKAVFRQRPPLPRYVNTFDISIVFNYLKQLPSNQELGLKLLTHKTLFLLIVSSLSRVSSVARLGPSLLVFKVSFT